MKEMAIKRIQVKNFKSFKDLDIELGKFNIVIGANASGKSNFIHIFEFLRDIAIDGLENAISMQGGIEYLRNININHEEAMSFDIEETHTNYDFALKSTQKALGFEITRDICSLNQPFIDRGKTFYEIIKISSEKGNIKYDNLTGKTSLKIEDKFPAFFIDESIPKNTLILENIIYNFIEPRTSSIYNNMSIYDFDPKLPKRGTPITGKAQLVKNGENLSIVLKNIIKYDDERRKLLNLLKDVLPFIDDINVEKFADKSLLFNLKESYSGNNYLPASFLSDGTINIAALIIALYFDKKPFTIIEEPEKSIHPFLISKVIGMMKDASQHKQIIVTTHNPEMIKHADLDDILLVSRDKEGFSEISRPSEKEEIKVFLKNDMGMDELYVQNLLEI